MEVMSALAVLALGTLAVFMYFKTRPPKPSPALDLDLSVFSPVADPGTCKRVVAAGRGALGPRGAAATHEECLSGAGQYVYRARSGQGPSAGAVVVLLDSELRVLGTRRTISR